MNWKINQLKITELYCVNKDNPLMHCNGKCYLSLQLKKIESDYKQSKEPFYPKNLKSTEFILFIEKVESNTFVTHDFAPQHFKGGFYEENRSETFIQSCFHPPCCTSHYFLTA